MSLLRLGMATLVTALISITTVTASTPDKPDAVVHALYHYSQAHFGFDPDIVKGYKPWVTPDLYARIVKKANAPVPKGDAPDIEGDLFLDSQDAPDKFVIGKSDIDAAKAKVGVDLLWPTEKRKLTVLLEQVNGVWKVSDVIYDKGEGKLSDLL